MPSSNGHGRNGHCVECAPPQLARNHYFTGKLLVERDFVDEQRYLIGKDRRHNQTLHGSGVACGLRVTQHPDEDCRRRYVVIEPGTAVDCCGREIVVDRTQYFDFRSQLPPEWFEPPAEGEEPAPPHRLQICLRYDECETEDVPALFDECGCDETQCLPNRVLEAYRLELRADAPRHAHEVHGARLERRATLSAAGVRHVALDETGKRLLVLTGTTAADGTESFGFVAFSTEDGRVVAPTLGGPGAPRDVAVSADGQEIYVAVATAAGDLEIRVHDEAGALAGRATLTGQAARSVVLASAPAAPRLYALVATETEAHLHAWDNPTTTLTHDSTGDLGAGAADLAVLPDGDHLLVATSGTENVRVVAASDLTVTRATLPGAPHALAVAETTAGARLFVADRDNAALRAFRVDIGATDPFPSLAAPLTLTDSAPYDVAASPAGRFVYVLRRNDDGSEGRVSVVDAHRLALGAGAEAVTDALELDGGREVAVASDGRRLYVAYDEEAPDGFGGVAVVDVEETACAEIFERTLEGCPECDGDDCLVLATIAGYRADDAVVDADIDNLSDRRILASTSVITDVVRCLLEQPPGAGERGPQGPPGERGPRGPAIDAVEATFLECVGGTPAEGSASINVDEATGTATLDLRIPQGCDGAPGPGIDDVDATFLPCVDDTPAAGSAALETDAAGHRILRLEIPQGCDGAPGPGIDDVDATFLPCVGDTPAEGSASIAVDPQTGQRVLRLEVPQGCRGPAGPSGTARVRTGVERITANANALVSVRVRHELGEVPVGIVLGIVGPRNRDIHGLRARTVEYFEQVNLDQDPFLKRNVSFLGASVVVPYDDHFFIHLRHRGRESESIDIRWVAVTEETE